MVTENLDIVRKKINEECIRGNRNPNEVTLIAVSKTKPVPLLQEAYDAGIRCFGENKVQEIMDKYEVFPKDIKWHMIGHLQRNKVKYIVDKVDLIHSVDSLKLAHEINKEGIKKNLQVSILIEVNVAGEASKFGIAFDKCLELVHEISKLSHVKVKGLMTIAPYVTNPEENREIFKKLKQLSVDIKTKNIDNVNMDILSMGMTGDYQVAIEEGATMVRVGTGIFGKRKKT